MNLDFATTPEQVRDYWLANITAKPDHNPDKEHFAVMFLDTRRVVKGFEIVSIGNLDSAVVHPREVFRAAIVAGASAIILAHNHPSGDPKPSEADVRVTRELIRAGELLKLEILDHVIVSRNNFTPYVSLRELGYFYK